MVSEYAISVVRFLVLAGMLISLSHIKTKQSVSFAIGVLIVSAIMLPLVDILRSNEPIFPEVDVSGNVEINDASIEVAYVDGIEKYVADRLGVPLTDVEVRIDGFDISTMLAERIYVTLSGDAIYCDYRALREEIGREFTKEGRCEVRIDGNE